MGYYTYYSLEVIGEQEEKTREIIGKLREESEAAEYAFDDDGTHSDNTKWYDWAKDMTEFSKQNPSYLFLLSGEGEEQPDLWKAYFKGGKIQMCRAKISYDDFSEEKLIVPEFGKYNELLND